jgi:hypothetical protein
MPATPPPDLTEAIDAILREATERILALVTEQQERWLEALEHQLETAETTLRERRRLAQGIRRAVRDASGDAPPPPPQRGSARIRTADVVDDLREVLAGRRTGLRIGELRELTGYGDMQLHRALRQLEEDREVVREGPPRKTVYRAGRRLRRGARTRRAAASAAPPRRSPRAQWVSTDDVKAAVEKALRNRKTGRSLAELCELTGYTDKQLHRAISVLHEEGRLRKAGAHRSMRYLLRKKR